MIIKKEILGNMSKIERTFMSAKILQCVKNTHIKAIA
jgi:hypothetical protein